MNLTLEQIKEELPKQLKAFREESLSQEWLDEVDITKSKENLVRIFYFKVPKKDSKSVKLYGLNGDVVNSDSVEGVGRYATQLGILIRKGGKSESEYEVGDIVFLPYDEACGREMNRDYLNLISNNSNMQLETTAKQQGITKEVPKRLRLWDSYVFYPAHNFGLPSLYADHYLLPSQKLKGRHDA